MKGNRVNMGQSIGRVAIMVSMLLGGIVGATGAPAAMAQATPGTYESPVSGAVIEVSAPWAFDAGISATGEDEDIIGIRSENGRLLIGYLPATTDVDTALQRALDVLVAERAGLQELDSGAYDDVTYALGTVGLDGVEHGVFTVYEGAGADGVVTSTTFVAVASSFGDALQDIQQHVTVDSSPVFNGVEGAGIQELLDAQAGIAGGSAPSEDSTPAITEASPDRDAGDRDARKLPTPTETPEATNESETGRAGQVGTEPADLSVFQDVGLVDEGIYVSPQYDTEVLWDHTWKLFANADEPVISDPESGTDSLTLSWNGDGVVFLYVDLFAADKLAPANFVDYWLSDEFLAENADPDAEILLDGSDRSSGAVLIRDYLANGEEMLMLREAISLDGGDTMALVTLVGRPDTFADAFADAADDITIDGDPAALTFTVRQIERSQEQYRRAGGPGD